MKRSLVAALVCTIASCTGGSEAGDPLQQGGPGGGADAGGAGPGGGDASSAGEGDGGADDSGHADAGDDGDSGDGDGDTGSGPAGEIGTQCETDAAFPVPEWPTGTPEQHGLSTAGLDAAAAYAGQNKTNCMAVIRHGVLVYEQYWNGVTPTTPVKSWSVAKSYASTLVGIALDLGHLGSVTDSIAQYVPALVGSPKAPITLHDLMAMSSGLYMEIADDNLTLASAPDMTKKALEADVTHSPGELWEYNNHAVQLLEPAVRQATGLAADEYAREHLWEPIGMEAEWLKDDVGQPALYQNVLASCRDHARFGYLFLHNGCWNGARVVPEWWVETATESSQDKNPGYGYWWWLSGETPTLDSTDFSELPGGSMHPFGPDDSYCAVGLGSQFIEVIPSLDMVVVRMGVAPHDDPLNWLNPLLMLQELFEDGKQYVHNGVLERVLDAVTD